MSLVKAVVGFQCFFTGAFIYGFINSTELGIDFGLKVYGWTLIVCLAAIAGLVL